MSWDVICSILLFMAAVAYLDDCSNATRFWQGFVQLVKVAFFLFFGCYFAGWVKIP
jgi:hypothetical protein